MVTPSAIAIGGALAAGAILRATEQEALLSGPEYIRDAQPEGLTRRVGLGIARAACQAYANDPTRPNAARATQLENACRPYLDSLGGGNGASISPPFEGAQCDGVAYDIVYREQYSSGNTAEATLQVGVIGPVFSISKNTNPDGSFTFGGTAKNGAWISSTIPSNRNANGGATFLRFIRRDGLADNCGNPSPEVRPPTAPPIPFPIPVPVVFSPDVDVNVDVEINPDGTINIDIGTGPITIDPFGDNGDGSDSSGGGPDDSPPSPEPGPETPGGNGGFGGDDMFGPPPVGRRWVGACITITNKPINQPPIPGSEPEDVYAAVVGNIRLVYQASGTRQTDTPVRIQARKVCVWEAVRKLNPVGVSVDLQPGFGYSYRPYSVPLDA